MFDSVRAIKSIFYIDSVRFMRFMQGSQETTKIWIAEKGRRIHRRRRSICVQA